MPILPDIARWPAWSEEEWSWLERRHADAALPPEWGCMRDGEGRNLLMACLCHGADQEFIDAFVVQARAFAPWTSFLAQEDAKGVGVLAYMFRFTTKRRFDYRDWIGHVLSAPPVSRAGKGLLWQLSVLARDTQAPLAWFTEMLCLDPRLLSLSPQEWAIGMGAEQLRPWIAARVLEPLRHLAGTLQTSASPDLHALWRYLRPAWEATPQPLGGVEELDDVMQVLSVVNNILGQDQASPFDRVRGWESALPAMSRLAAYASLRDCVFADLLSRGPLQGAGWAYAVDRAMALCQARILEEDTACSGDGQAGRRL